MFNHHFLFNHLFSDLLCLFSDSDRLTSKTPAKRLNALLKVQFNDQPSTTKMTLNSIYSLVVNIKKNVIRDDFDGMFCSARSNVLDFVACQSRKYPPPSPPPPAKEAAAAAASSPFETWTLLSTATYGKKNKMPQEHLNGKRWRLKVLFTVQ
jgi:hypothetical protein